MRLVAAITTGRYWADILFCFQLHRQQAREYAAKMLPQRLQMQVEIDGSQKSLGGLYRQHYTAFTLCLHQHGALMQQCGHDARS